MEEFIRGIPKCDLHVHMFGNTEPEMVFKLAQRNNIKLSYNSVEELSKAYKFTCLDDFFKVFRAGLSVVKTKEDVRDICYDYLKHAHEDNVKYCELHFNAVSEVTGMTTKEMMEGLIEGMNDAKRDFGIEAKAISALSRRKPLEETRQFLEDSKLFKDYIVAIGLASAEKQFPPHIFTEIFEEAGKFGFKRTAHSGEEGPPEYIWEAINFLKVDRIDHGVSAIKDPKLVQYLAEKQIPLTICPISNLKLNVVKSLEEHPIKKFIDAGVFVTINSDDPTFFSANLSENYIAVQKAFNLTKEEIVILAKNSFIASYLPSEKIEEGIKLIDEYAKAH